MFTSSRPSGNTCLFHNAAHTRNAKVSQGTVGPEMEEGTQSAAAVRVSERASEVVVMLPRRGMDDARRMRACIPRLARQHVRDAVRVRVRVRVMLTDDAFFWWRQQQGNTFLSLSLSHTHTHARTHARTHAHMIIRQEAAAAAAAFFMLAGRRSCRFLLYRALLRNAEELSS